MLNKSYFRLKKVWIYLGMRMVQYEEIIKIVLKALQDTYTKLSNTQ